MKLKNVNSHIFTDVKIRLRNHTVCTPHLNKLVSSNAVQAKITN